MSHPDLTVDGLNAATADSFAAIAAPVFENAPWVTEGLAAVRPFASLTALHGAMMQRLLAAPSGKQAAFLRGHPMLSPSALRQGITAESMAEQRAAGIDALDSAAAARLDAGNAAYHARFGFPFILAVRHATPAVIFAALERRTAAEPHAELAEALREIAAISWMRLLDRVAPAPTGGISLHVLDTVRSRPGAGLDGELWRCLPSQAAMCMARFTTDANGRAPTMLGGGGLFAAMYEWRLDTGAYFARHGIPTPDRGFLPSLLVRFGVVNPEEHFHVPVLLAPGSYTTYRGS